MRRARRWFACFELPRGVATSTGLAALGLVALVGFSRPGRRGEAKVLGMSGRTKGLEWTVLYIRDWRKGASLDM